MTRLIWQRARKGLWVNPDKLRLWCFLHIYGQCGRGEWRGPSAIRLSNVDVGVCTGTENASAQGRGKAPSVLFLYSYIDYADNNTHPQSILVIVQHDHQNNILLTRSMEVFIRSISGHLKGIHLERLSEIERSFLSSAHFFFSEFNY